MTADPGSLTRYPASAGRRAHSSARGSIRFAITSLPTGLFRLSRNDVVEGSKKSREAAKARRTHGLEGVGCGSNTPPESVPSATSAGVFAAWTWVRSTTDSNGIARWVESVGGESPAETQRRGAMVHQPLRLGASAGFFTAWTWVRSATASNGIARCVTSVGGESPAETQRRRDMGPQPLRLRASAGVFTSWAWVRSATDSNGIACWVTSVGGDSPAGPGFALIRYDGVLARSLPQPTRL